MKRQTIAGAAALLLLVLASVWNTAVRGNVLQAGERCLTVLIPSLFFYSMLAAFCIRSGGLRAVSRLFGKSGLLWGVFLFSQIGGYPVGAQLLHELVSTGELDTKQAKRLQCICFGCGPGFLLGTVCRGFSLKLSLWVMLSVMLPHLLLAPFLLRGTEQRETLPQTLPLAQQLTQAAESAADAMLKVTAMILAFAAVMGILDGMGVFSALPAHAAAVLRSCLEVSSVTELRTSGGSLPMAAACLSFGGLCVHLQLAAINGGSLDWVRFWLLRLAASVMTYAVCAVGVRSLFRGIVPVFLPAAEPALTTRSVLPGACLLVMSVMLLRRSDRSSG